MSEHLAALTAEIPQNARRYLRMGWSVTFFGFLGFMIWAGFAPLDKGVATSGTVIVTGNRKAVQAAATGTIKAIDVKDGDRVAAGQRLIQLRQEQLLAQRQAVSQHYFSLLAAQNRLMAEKDNAEKLAAVPLPDEEADRVFLAGSLRLQQHLLTSRRQALDDGVTLLNHSVAALDAEISGLQKSLHSREHQLAILGEQSATMQKLLAKKYLSRVSWLEVERERAEVASELHAARGEYERLLQQRQETSMQIAQRYSDYRRDVLAQLAQNETEISEYRQKRQIADVDLQNTRIVSPASGIVVGLNVFTPGGIVQTGETLLYILPEQEALMVEARLPIHLVDKVRKGLPVELMFSAFSQNSTPKIPGVVTLVAADSITDKETGSPYYQLQIAVTPEGKALLRDHAIRPGMPVEVFVRTGSRSLLNYLFKPIRDRASTSLTEE